MKAPKNHLWPKILAGMVLVSMLFFAVIVIVLALIPLYLKNRSVGSSQTLIQVYIVTNVTFKVNSTGGGRRSVRSTLTQLAPTDAMITSAQTQLNTFFAQIKAHTTIKKATMPDVNTLLMDLFVYFDQKCMLCDGARLKSISQLLATGQSVIIRRQYSSDCSSAPTDAGDTVMTLQGSGDSSSMSSTTTSTDSIVQQSDVCANVTKCTPVSSRELIFSITPTTSQSYTYYCFAWTLPTAPPSFGLQFLFNSAANQYIYLDDISLNSTNNLVQNGNFETYNANAENPYAPWVSSCGASCDTTDNPRSGQRSFRSAGDDVSLEYSSPIANSDASTTHSFGFWLKFDCTPAAPCLIHANLTSLVGEN